jgi:hypothetical protein
VDVFAEGTLGGLIGINARTMRGQRVNHMQRRGGRAGAYPLALGVASTSNGTIAGDAYWDIQTTQATRDVYSGTGMWATHAGATHPVLRCSLPDR